MRVVYPELDIPYFPLPPEEHVGWIWLVKMVEGDEWAEDAWIYENPRDAVNRAKQKYPNAKLVSCHRRIEVTTRTAFRYNLDGSVYD